MTDALQIKTNKNIKAYRLGKKKNQSLPINICFECNQDKARFMKTQK